MSDLVGNPDDRFYCVATKIIFEKVPVYNFTDLNSIEENSYLNASMSGKFYPDKEIVKKNQQLSL